MIGTTISHYKVLEQLGEGGMGVVYKAEDTKLERTVALKFLASHLLNDAEAKERFLREAKAAAALHHPNICTVHEIDEADGKTFLAMAFLKGATLEERIAEGPMPLKDVLELGRQVADGLQAAHAEGIVHRDIKPANILVSPDGRATIMDFGLARLTEASRLTKPDSTMGTAAYMSPEQLQGMEVDHRSDNWSLGVVLYEMVAGLRPFKGQYDQALAYEIVNEDPDPLTGVRAGVPMELEFIVGKCVEKDADSRYQNAADIAVDLRNLQDKLKSGRSTVVPTANLATGVLATANGKRTITPAAALPPDVVVLKRSNWRALIGLAALLSAALLALAILYFGESVPRQQTARFLVQAPDGVVYVRRAAEISPDGRHLAFIGVQDSGERLLWVRSLNSVEPRPLVGSEGVQNPFWSPDSRFLGFFADGKLKKIDISGGPPQSLCDAPDGRGGTWAKGSADGVIVFAPSGRGGLHSVSAAGGEPSAVTVVADESATHRFPYFLPDGHHFFYSSRGDGVYVGSLDGEAEGSQEPILIDDTPVRYAPPSDGRQDGYLLFARGNSLMAQQFDPARLELTSQPFPVAEGVSASTAGYNPSDFSVSHNGTLAYRTQSRFGSLSQLAWFDRKGKSLGFVGEPGVHATVSLSPDDSNVAISKVSTAPPLTGDIWIHDMARGVESRFTFDSALELSHIWSPDGKRLAFSSNRAGSYNLYLKPASGAGEAESLLEGEKTRGPRSWSQDGDSILYVERGLFSDWDLWVLPLEGERKPVPYLRTEFNEVLGQFSPDGRWVAYASDESGAYEIYVQPYPANGGKWQVSTAGGSQPRWRGDGKELYYLDSDNTLMATQVEVDETFRPAVPTALFRVEDIRVQSTLASSYFHYDVSNDGQRFLADVSAQKVARTAVTVVQNWQAELER